MRLSSPNKWKGISAAIMTALFQGFEALLYPLFGLVIAFSLYQSLGFSIAILALKELITIVLFIFIVNPFKIIAIIKRLVLKKDTWVFFKAGIVGTTTGNLAFIVAIQLAGPEYGVILTSFYPVFAIFVSNYIMRIKTKEPPVVWFLIFIASICGFLFIFLPAIVGSSQFSYKLIIGSALGAVAAFFWAVEGAYIGKGLKHIKRRDIQIVEIAILRSMAAFLMSWIVLMPAMLLLSLTSVSTFTSPYFVLKILFQHWEAILIMFAIATNLVFLRFVHIYAINKIGTKLAAIIDANNFIIPPLFSTFLSYANLKLIYSDANIYSGPIWWSWLIIIPIFIAVILIIYSHRPRKNEKIEKILN